MAALPQTTETFQPTLALVEEPKDAPVYDLRPKEEYKPNLSEADLKRGLGLYGLYKAEVQHAALVGADPDLHLLRQRAGEAGLVHPDEEIPDMQALLAKTALIGGFHETGSQEHTNALIYAKHHDAIVHVDHRDVKIGM